MDSRKNPTADRGSYSKPAPGQGAARCGKGTLPAPRANTAPPKGGHDRKR